MQASPSPALCSCCTNRLPVGHRAGESGGRELHIGTPPPITLFQAPDHGWAVVLSNWNVVIHTRLLVSGNGNLARVSGPPPGPPRSVSDAPPMKAPFSSAEPRAAAGQWQIQRGQAVPSVGPGPVPRAGDQDKLPRQQLTRQGQPERAA